MNDSDAKFMAKRQEWMEEKRSELTGEMERLAKTIVMEGIRRINHDNVVTTACLTLPARIRYLRALQTEAMKMFNEVVDGIAR